MTYDVVVVGGGVAGVIAAGIASLRGASTLLIEAKDSLSDSLTDSFLNESCLTIRSRRIQFQHQLFSGAEFLEESLKRFSSTRFITFIEGLALPVTIDSDERVSLNGDKNLLVRAFEGWVRRCGVTVQCRSCVQSLDQKDSVVNGVYVAKGVQRDIFIAAKSVIVATGAPFKGSLSRGLAETLPHQLSDVYPSLFAIPVSNFSDLASPVSGLFRLFLWRAGKKVIDFSGDLKIDSLKINGDAAYDMSHYLARELSVEPEKLSLTIDFLPKLDDGDLKQAINEYVSSSGNSTVADLLKTFVSQEIVSTLILDAEIDPKQLVKSLSKASKKDIAAKLKRYELNLSSIKRVEPQSCSGGLILDSINPETLQSYALSGLLFAGAVIDSTGPSGGYNMQIAVSTAYRAGEASVEMS